MELCLILEIIWNKLNLALIGLYQRTRINRGTGPSFDEALLAEPAGFGALAY